MEEQAPYGKKDDESEDEQKGRPVKSQMTVIYYEDGEIFASFPGNMEDATELISLGFEIAVKTFIEEGIKERIQNRVGSQVNLKSFLRNTSKLN